MRRIKAHKTIDGKIFESKKKAIQHEKCELLIAKLRGNFSQEDTDDFICWIHRNANLILEYLVPVIK